MYCLCRRQERRKEGMPPGMFGNLKKETAQNEDGIEDGSEKTG